MTYRHPRTRPSRGTVCCPVKGDIALERCHRLQLRQFARCADCTCRFHERENRARIRVFREERAKQSQSHSSWRAQSRRRMTGDDDG